MTNLKHHVEALLFSSGKRMEAQEIAKICHKPLDEVLEALKQLKYDYEEKNSSLMIVDESNFWKLSVKEHHLPIVSKIVTETELSKTLMETLAVIAFKYPIKQADLIKIRTNKAYDHLNELEELGYISRQKYSRTKLIKLTQKFFEYFDLPPEKLKEQFNSFEGIAKAIEEKESEIKKMKEEQKRTAQEAKKSEEKEIDLIDEEGHKEKLETYNIPKKEQRPKIEIAEEKLGNLDVVKLKTGKEKREKIKEKKIEEPEEESEVDKKVEEMLKPFEEAEELSGEKIAAKIKEEEEKTENYLDIEESEVDKKVEEMLHPPKETEDEAEPEKQKTEKKVVKEKTELDKELLEAEENLEKEAEEQDKKRLK